MNVLVVATGRKSKGGINSVINAYLKSEFWDKWHCYWLESHNDGSMLFKIFVFIRASFLFMLKVPFYQIIHIHLSEPVSAIRKTWFLKIARLFNKVVIAHFHSFSTETTINGKYQNVYYRFFKSSDKILVLSNSWKKWLIQKWPEFGDKIEVLYNPCPKVSIDDKTPRSKTVLFAGALIERKGYADLIEAFAEVKNRNSEWRLVFAGNGDIEKGRQLATRLNIQDKIIFSGWVSGSKKDLLFRNSSVFCLPSYAEGFPMAVLDAWAYGLPVITTPVGGLPDIIVHNQNAIVIKPGDPEDIANAIEKLINDERLRAKLSEEALKMSNTIFSLDQVTYQIDKLYSSFFQIEKLPII